MTIKVHNFYTRDKLSTNRYHNILMSSAIFYILCAKDGHYKEFSCQIPKKYHYENIFFNYVDFPQNKINEFNVLSDFIKNNKTALIEKWGLSKDEYCELKYELKLCLIKAYSTCSFPRRVILEATVLFNLFVNRILRRIKLW